MSRSCESVLKAAYTKKYSAAPGTLSSLFTVISGCIKKGRAYGTVDGSSQEGGF